MNPPPRPGAQARPHTNGSQRSSMHQPSPAYPYPNNSPQPYYPDPGSYGQQYPYPPPQADYSHVHAAPYTYTAYPQPPQPEFYTVGPPQPHYPPHGQYPPAKRQRTDPNAGHYSQNFYPHSPGDAPYNPVNTFPVSVPYPPPGPPVPPIPTAFPIPPPGYGPPPPALYPQAPYPQPSPYPHHPQATYPPPQPWPVPQGVAAPSAQSTYPPPRRGGGRGTFQNRSARFNHPQPSAAAVPAGKSDSTASSPPATTDQSAAATSIAAVSKKQTLVAGSDGQPEKLSEVDYLSAIKQDEYFEWDSEVPYFKEEDGDEEVDERFSLGEIAWIPAHSISRALPADYWQLKMMAAIEDDSADSEDADRGYGISRHVDLQLMEDRFRPAQKMSDWPAMRNDPIFAEVPADCELIPIDEVVANRARPADTPGAMDAEDDDDAEEGEIRRSTLKGGWHMGQHLEPNHADIPPPSKEIKREQSLEIPPEVTYKQESRSDDQAAQSAPGHVELAAIKSDDDDEAYSPLPIDTVGSDIHLLPRSNSASQLDRDENSAAVHSIEITIEEPTEIEAPQEDIAETSQSAVTGTVEEVKPAVSGVSASLIKTSLGTFHPLPPKPPMYPADQQQEAILAKLGVTGAPQPVFNTPGPVRRSRSRSPEKVASLNQPPVHTSVAKPRTPPPPAGPPPSALLQIPEDDDPWRMSTNGHDSPKSQTSQHTIAGSDFGVEAVEKVEEAVAVSHGMSSNAKESEMEQTASPPAGSKAARKRSRAESEGRDDGVRRQYDDYTPRLRARQPKVAPAYSRRW